jgi:hypothetical protein
MGVYKLFQKQVFSKKGTQVTTYKDNPTKDVPQTIFMELKQDFYGYGSNCRNFWLSY